MSTENGSGAIKEVISGQVSNEVDRQRNIVTELCDAVDKLETRLATVIICPEPQPTETEKERSSKVDMATTICNSNDVVKACVMRLNDLVCRIEV